MKARKSSQMNTIIFKNVCYFNRHIRWKILKYKIRQNVNAKLVLKTLNIFDHLIRVSDDENVQCFYNRFLKQFVYAILFYLFI